MNNNNDNELIIKYSNIEDFSDEYINIDNNFTNDINFNEILNKIKELFKDYDNNTLNNDEVITKIVESVLNKKNFDNDSLKNKSVFISQLIQNFFKHRNIEYKKDLHNTATLFFIIKNIHNEKKKRKLNTEDLIITKELFLILYKYYNKRSNHSEKQKLLIANAIYDIVYTYINQIEQNNKRNLKIRKIEKIYVLKYAFIKILDTIEKSKSKRNINLNNVIMLINFTYPLIEFHNSLSSRSINIDTTNILYLTQIILQFSSNLFVNLNSLFRRII